jgi:hypothetical protein
VTDSLRARYERDPNVVTREIAGERILVPIRKQVADMAAIYVLNETGARIWNLLDGQRSLADIVEILVQEYLVESDTVQADIVEIVDQLRDLGMLRAAKHAL